MPDIVRLESVMNVTYQGQNGDYPDRVPHDMSDAEILTVVRESLQTGYIPGIDQQTSPNLEGFVVDRFEAKDGLPSRIMVRPKVEFG